jgi:prepilin-type processing-associated H-X9-DG protein
MTHRPWRGSLRNGFTRPELLLVVMMTATLTALLFPVFIRASQPKPQTPDSACASNLKQLGLGIMQYTQDYDERMPILTYRGNKTSWRSLITPYIQNNTLFQCPLNPHNVEVATGDKATEKSQFRTLLKPGVKPQTTPEGDRAYMSEDYYTVVDAPIAVSYAANSNVINVPDPLTGNTTGSADLNNVASLIMVGESMRGDAALRFDFSATQFGRGEVLFAGHDDPGNQGMSDDVFTNCLFADGHVKAFPPRATTDMWFNVAPTATVRRSYARKLLAAEEFYAAVTPVEP